MKESMLKRFISYYKPHVVLFLFDMFCATVVAASGLVTPMIARVIINDYAPNGNMKYLWLFSALLLGIYLCKAVCNYMVGYYGHIVGIYMQADMRRDLFKKFETLPFSYYDTHKTGDLLSRLVNDLFDVSELAHHGPENLFLSALMLIGSFFVLASINLPLTLIMFAVIPFIILFTTLARRGMLTAMKASRKQIAAVNADVENSLSGIRETKACVAEAKELRKFDVDNGKFMGYRRAAMHHLGLFEATMTFLSDLLYLVVIAIGGVFLLKGKIDAGDFAAFVLYIGMFLNPINRFVSLFQQLQEGLTGFERFCEVMDTPGETDEGKVTLTDVKGDIVFSDVSFRYDSMSGDTAEDLVISGLSLHVKPGETLALVGPSGGGKTTLCHLIPRFYNIVSGNITLDGVDVHDITLSSLRQNIGIVSQDVFLFDGTIRENITYGVDGTVSEEQLHAAAKSANIHDFVMTLDRGYDTEVGERGVRLSGGQKQRIAIARLFLKNPKLLILDEATSALDNVTEMQIQSALEELSHGRTVIVVAHRLSTVRNADTIAVVDHSGILERGTHDELLAKNGAYARLYHGQFKKEDFAVC